MMFKSTLTFYNLILVFFTGLFFLSFLGLGHFFGYILLPLVFINSTFISKNLDATYILLLIFSLSYAAFYFLNSATSLQFVLMYAIFPSILYLVGKYLALIIKSEVLLFYLLFIVSFVYSFRALISILLVFRETGFGMTLEYGRNLPMIWSGGAIASATLMALYFPLNMCIPVLLFTKSIKRNFFFVSGAFLIFLISMICVLRIGSRTQLVICIFILFFGLLYIIPKQRISANVRLFFIILLILGYIATNVSFDLDAEWLSSYSNRLQNSGNSAGAGGRDELWSKSLVNLVEKPFGWSYDEFGFSHNLWLDVARVGGVLTFLILIIFSLKAFFQIKNSFNYLENKSFKVMVLSYGLAFLLIFSGEPILDANVYVFPLFCFYLGTINGYVSYKKNQE